MQKQWPIFEFMFSTEQLGLQQKELSIKSLESNPDYLCEVHVLSGQQIIVLIWENQNVQNWDM